MVNVGKNTKFHGIVCSLLLSRNGRTKRNGKRSTGSGSQKTATIYESGVFHEKIPFCQQNGMEGRGKAGGRQGEGRQHGTPSMPRSKETAQPKPRRNLTFTQSIASKAFFTSSMMSSIFSSPTEKRTSPGSMPAALSCSSVS